MRPDMIVEEAELAQCATECIEGSDCKLIETGFKRTKETFGAVVYAEGMAVFVQEDGEYVHLAAYEEVA